MAKLEDGKRDRVVWRGMASITQQAVPQPARLGAVSSWQMGLVAANHPFSDFADFTQSNFNNRRKEWDFFFHKLLIPFLFFFLPSNCSRSLYFGLRNMDNISMKNCGDKKLKINVVPSLCSKPNGFGFSRSFLCSLKMLLSCMPCVHNQLWFLLSVLTFLAQSLESQQDKFWVLRIVFLMLYG